MVGHVTPYKIKKEFLSFKESILGHCCSFHLSRLFLTIRECWLLHNADTQCTVQGERQPKGRDSLFEFLLSYDKSMTFISY